MKKLLSILSVGALATASMLAAINWNSIENLAAGSTVVTSSKPAEAQTIVDNNDGTGWQAVPATHEYTHDWVLIDLGSEKTFTDIEIIWEASHCKQYSVYVSTEAIPYTAHEESTEGEGAEQKKIPAYNEISSEWLANHTPAATSGNDTEAGYTDNITFDTTQTGQYVLIYANEYNNFGSQYGMRIFEVRLANIESRDDIAGLKLTQEGNAVAGGDAVTVSVVPVNKLGAEMGLNTITGLTLTCDNAAVTITETEAGKYSVSSTEIGEFTLTATAMAGETLITGAMTLNVAYNWTNIDNVATNKTVYGRVKADSEDPNPPANAVDGNVDNYYQYNGEWGGGDSWVLVDLGDVYNISAIGALYTGNTSTGKFMVGYALDATEALNKINADGTDYVWNFTEGWNFSAQLSRTPGSIDTYICPAGATARYIVVKDADNPGGKPCLNEIYVAGTVREAAKAADITINITTPGLVIGETTEVSTSVVDQYGDPFEGTPTITVNGAEYANGVITGNAKGMVTVTATLGDLTKTAQFYVANQDDYCLDGCTITASEGAAENKAPVTDGGKDIANWGADYVLAEAEPAGEHTHWFQIELAKPYDIDLMAALWEGASPADYDIYLGETADNMTLYYSQKDKAGLQNYSDRFSGKEMKNIKFIKVVTTKNATVYGIKLHDFKVYGTSNAQSVATSIEVSASDNYVPTGTEITLSAKVFDQFGAEMPDAQVTYSCENADAVVVGNVFKADKIGGYNVVATCGDATGSIDLDVVANGDFKLAADSQALKNTVTLNGTVLENVNSFNNNEIQIADVPSTLVFTFDNIVDFDLLEIRWEGACPSDYTVEATYEDNSTATILTVTGRKFVNGVFPVDKIINSEINALDLGTVAKANLTNIKSLKFNITGRDHNYPIRLLGMTAYSVNNYTGIQDIAAESNGLVDVYSIQGIKVRSNVEAQNALEGLPRGIYFVGGRKVIK